MSKETLLKGVLYGNKKRYNERGRARNKGDVSGIRRTLLKMSENKLSLFRRRERMPTKA